MDPISGVASVVAIIGAANTAIRGINRIRSLVKAPKAINGLINEVEALRRLLTDIQHFHEPIEAHRLLLLRGSSKGPRNEIPETESPLSVYLTQAKMKLAELDELIDRNFKEGSERRLKGSAARFAWFSSEGRVKDLRNDIHSINVSISTCLMMTVTTAQFCLQNSLAKTTSDTQELVFPTMIMLNVTYHFPHWLLSGVIDTSWGSDSVGCPTVALRMPRIRPDTAPIFHLAAAGDIAGMQRMFRLGLASPDDVSYAFGYSVLHFTVDMEDVEAIKFLIREGANPMLANSFNLTAVDLTWNRILCKRTTGTKGAELALLFGKANCEDQIQNRRLTRLQQVILGLVEVDLDMTLNSSSHADINATDADGNTVLSWAARSCNAGAVQALLKRGAESHQASRFGSTAIHYAASARSPNCIRPLLEAGADPNVRNTCLLETPVHVAALRHDDPEMCLAPLLEYGADVDAQDHEGSSALAFAIQANHARSLKFLLDHGSDADIPDNIGIPPVGIAVIYKHSDMLQMLLERGASPNFTTDTGQTLLHLVALYGDSDVVSVLEDAECQLSHEDLDEKGADPLTYAKARGDEVFFAAFTKLISAKPG
ncbi:MAG: hypothetical protein Q9195_009307 [Heterodermia aff. obscurata]